MKDISYLSVEGSMIQGTLNVFIEEEATQVWIPCFWNVDRWVQVTNFDFDMFLTFEDLGYKISPFVFC